MNWKKHTLVTGEMTYSLSLGLVYIWVKVRQKDYNSEPTSILFAGYEGAKRYTLNSEKISGFTLKRIQELLVVGVVLMLKEDLLELGALQK